jgi:large subunit GTPase 1
MPRSQGTSRKGKPKKHERAAGMGRSLQKSRTKRHTPSASLGGMQKREGVENINMEEGTHVQAAIDNRASVLDVNDLDDFLIQAEMADREFLSEKEQIVVLDPTARAQSSNGDSSNQGIILKGNERVNPNFAFKELSVPRRPAWDETTTAEQLDQREKDSFLEWRRAIAEREEELALKSSTTSSLGVTPFEKNLEIWRQLWRVLERCSCIVQIVDARNPLFYLSQDLKQYTTEELGKPMLLLINKSDYLSPVQRQAWSDYLSHPDHKWEHVFFSAHESQKAVDEEAAREAEEEERQRQNEFEILSQDSDSDDDDDENNDGGSKLSDKSKNNSGEEMEKIIEKRASKPSTNIGVDNPLSRNELLEWLQSYGDMHNCSMDPKYGRVPFGMVGFPNVGKSSVINVLMGSAKNAHGVVRVGVAAQPGKTKHFQTLLLPDRDDMLLCDCPGLVFPSFVSNTADLIAAGVYPIAQMRDWIPVMNLLCQRIPREVLNAQYTISIPLPSDDVMYEAKQLQGSDDIGVPRATAEDFLTTYCVARSVLAAGSGGPDFQRAARTIIMEYATGKLLYCHSPPNFDVATFQRETLLLSLQKTKKLREKLFESRVNASDGNHEPQQSEMDTQNNIEDDDMLLELLGGMSTSADKNSNEISAGQSRRQKKWGKKGRKGRNKDPYGCYSTPDEVLGGTEEKIAGVLVKGGKKHQRKNYTRAVGYGTARVFE